MKFLIKNLKLLACPICKGELAVKNSIEYENKIISGNLYCALCNKNYEVKDGILYLIAKNYKNKFYEEWKKKQKLGEKAYKKEEKEYKLYSDNIAREFGKWCSFEGLILDVGCGIWNFPVYIESVKEIDKFIGIDPLKGEKKKFPFIVGMGEYLPFKDNQFDNCICATVLDHVIEPRDILIEINRVLKNSGELFLWIGIFGKNRKDGSFLDNNKKTFRESLPYLVANFKVSKIPKYFVIIFRKINKKFRFMLNKPLDDLHFNYFYEDDIVKILEKAGFTVRDRKLIDNSLFIKAEKQ